MWGSMESSTTNRHSERSNNHRLHNSKELESSLKDTFGFLLIAAREIKAQMEGAHFPTVAGGNKPPFRRLMIDPMSEPHTLDARQMWYSR
jgi:hypothetical protein